MDKAQALAVARDVNWYTEPQEVVADERGFLSQIMARGNLESVRWMLLNYPPETLRDAYRRAPAGLYPRKAWAYWGLMLLGSPTALPYPVRFPGMQRDDAAAYPGF